MRKRKRGSRERYRKKASKRKRWREKNKRVVETLREGQREEEREM